jgi:hypothetical protein
MHLLIKHAHALDIDVPELTFDGIRATVLALAKTDGCEGIVWHHEDGRMVKIKARDFGPMTATPEYCHCNEFDSRDVTVCIHAGDILITHLRCGLLVRAGDGLMSEPMPMTLTYSVDKDAEEAYQVLAPATAESAE